MQDVYWEHIEWEIANEELVINPQWKTKRFVNTLPFSMNGIHQITIRRDEEYNLVAVAEGDYVETEECQLEEGTLIKESVLKGIWNHYYIASLINCFATNLTTKMMTENNREDALCDLELWKVKCKLDKHMPKLKEKILVEWYINAPHSTVLFTGTTDRCLKVRLNKKRGDCSDRYVPLDQQSFSRDTVAIEWENTKCYISKVPPQYAPQWADKLSIEYRAAYGYIPDKSTREGIRELAGFFMGRDLKLVGTTIYGKNAQIIRAMAQNPQSVNIRKVCQLCNQEIIPVHYYGDDSNNFQMAMEQMLPVYLHSELRKVIHDTLPLYWTSFLLYVNNAIPVIASAIEALQKAWFSLEENKSAAVYYPKQEFQTVKSQLVEILDTQLKDSEYKTAVKNKVDQLNQMSVRDRNELFFQQLGIEYGEREMQAIRVRNVYAHGGSESDQSIETMIDAKVVLQLLYAKIVLKLLHYQGPYINWSKPGHPREEL